MWYRKKQSGYIFLRCRGNSGCLRFPLSDSGHWRTEKTIVRGLIILYNVFGKNLSETGSTICFIIAGSGSRERGHIIQEGNLHGFRNGYTRRRKYEEGTGEMKNDQRPTLMQTQSNRVQNIIITALIMAALILFVFYFNLPNPNMILIVGLVLCSALFGFGGGVTASVIMLFYSLFFFSTDHSFIHFTAENLQKVGVTLVGVIADMLLVCFLKRAEVQAFQKVDALTTKIDEENQKLHRLSLTDALTGIRNRMALRQDYALYQGRNVTVMMLDLDDFKMINDTRGHEEGDRILRETAALLTDTFGEDHCYRYGGDEFLVIVPDLTDAAFQEKLDALMRGKPTIEQHGVSFSVGYVHAEVRNTDSIQSLIAEADERMYETKRDKKRVPMAGSSYRTRAAEYSVKTMKAYLDEMSRKYDLARLVDPIECRILELHDDGRISMNEACYGIWNAEQKCINCSSAIACRTGCHQEKAEHFQDHDYFVQSNPVSLTLPDGSVYSAVVELVSVKAGNNSEANNRAAENVGSRASHYQAHHDHLTNVLNAEAFYELSRKMLKETGEPAWVMVTGNIMNFRLINTLFGEQKGNEALIRTASALRELSEEAGGLCGRLGSDQFALLLPAEKYQEATLRTAAQMLAEAFNSGLYSFCIHFGVYRIEDASMPVSVMCGRANSALRTIREDMTRHVAYCNTAIMESILFEQRVISGFEEALASGQFQMYLQPLVRENGGVIGAEALVRWRMPDGTVIQPADFIETLEHAGLIHKLDMYMWERAVRQLSAWKDTEKKRLTISVNMSAKDFYSIDVYQTLTELIEKYGVDSHLLRLEITETALLVEPDKSDSVVSSLRKRGFLVEIDDFGKGYSSLSLLKNIQADALKIDMSFLREIKDKKRSRIILESVINMADALGMEVITEGVETQQQLQDLTAMGCRQFQGYYFSMPVPVEDFEKKVSVQ